MLLLCWNTHHEAALSRQSRLALRAVGVTHTSCEFACRTRFFACLRLFSFPYKNHLIVLIIGACDCCQNAPQRIIDRSPIMGTV